MLPTTTVPQPAENNSSCFHVVLPRNSRNTIIVNIPQDFSDADMTVKKCCEKSFENYNIELVNFEQMSKHDTFVQCKCVFIKIPKKFMNELANAGIEKCRFYVGLDEKKTSIHLNPPPEDELALTNREGVPAQHMSTIVNTLTYGA